MATRGRPTPDADDLQTDAEIIAAVAAALHDLEYRYYTPSPHVADWLKFVLFDTLTERSRRLARELPCSRRQLAQLERTEA
jgi:hypothetical protein